MSVNALASVALGTSLSVSSEKGMSMTQLLRYIMLMHRLGFAGSMVSGDTICGGSTSPTLPTHSIEPLRRRSMIVLFIKSLKGIHFAELLKIL